MEEGPEESVVVGVVRAAIEDEAGAETETEAETKEEEEERLVWDAETEGATLREVRRA